ncbi:MAG: 3,4-dehydroadipyl-CoA semialdehyde dehydrogenase [Pseudorhodoplanes sp.]|uniref:3,4-dehydroadipyl-CoA semialdehyde dehydrogenase n=1 Tax=Pseudorhodoplanes sp. TaxID=1934341 RepID=UPI003D0B2E4B
MSDAPEILESYLNGAWRRGEGVETELVDPVHGTVLATASARGLDLKAALDSARKHGGPALRALSFAERAKLIGAVADVLIANRAKYEAIAVANSGNTKIDAAIDIDGGIGTLKYYARLGGSLGGATFLLDEKPVRLAKAENFQAIHLLAPRHGVAVCINAFNFPSWGLWEKAAVALLAGVPVLAKPASSTALLTHAMVRDVIAAKVLPEGAIGLLCGGAGNLLDGVTAEDVIAFTGSSETAARILKHPNILARGVHVNIEADSVNAALLAPGASDAAFDAFVKEVGREMTVKAGQKCTAIRRVFAPADRAGVVAEALLARLKKTTLGDPRDESVRMGPLVTRAQQAAAFDGIGKIANNAQVLTGGATAPSIDGIDPTKSAFVAPTLMRVADGAGADAVHDTEVFGPAATIVPYQSEDEAFALITRGGGSLVASVYGDDHAFFARAVAALGPSHGRLLMVEPSIADAHTGHGIVMPQCHHGGPGRAGNGEELGGLHGLRLYHQRLAVQGSMNLLAALQAKAYALH